MEERKVCCVLLASSWGCFLQNHTDTIFSLLLPALQTDLTDWISKSDNSDDHLGCNDGEKAKGERSTTVIGKRDGTDSADESCLDEGWRDEATRCNYIEGSTGSPLVETAAQERGTQSHSSLED